VLARPDDVVLDVHLSVDRGLGQRDLDRHRHVAALHRAAPAAASEHVAGAAEERVEDVGERSEALERRLEPARGQTLMAVAVVDLAPLRVREDLVRLGQLLELLLGVGVVAVDVGMQLARLRAEGLLDLPLVGVPRDPEDLVGVALHSS
jgi:hypothetical protein